MARGALPGRNQTVPIAELWALCRLAELTAGNLDVAIDASYVVKGWKRGPQWHHRTNQSLWNRLWLAVQNRAGDLEVTWSKSHCTEGQLEQGLTSPWGFWVNSLADSLAGKAAEESQLPETVADLVRWVDSRAVLILNRLISACRLWQAQPEAAKEKAEPKAKAEWVGKEARILQAISGSAHFVVTQATVLVCRHCNTRASKRLPVADVLKWIGSPCKNSELRPVIEDIPPFIHPTHSYMKMQGCHFCAVCGDFVIEGVTSWPRSAWGIALLQGKRP
jgi:hypothetical protein